MKKLLVIVMMFSLMGLLSVMAQEVKPKQTEIVDLGKGIKLQMALIPAGKFMMGSPETEKNRGEDEIQHEVTITKPFYIGTYEVTQEQWQAVMGNNPSEVKAAKLPLTNVSWGMCQDFIKKLNDKTNGGYRLPTEAEWEYACRGETTTPYFFGNEITPKDANFGGSNLGKSVPVASNKANAYGLHDMHGNIWEWCEDWYGPYREGKATDPKGVEVGDKRVARGGSFYDSESDARSSNRYPVSPSTRNGYIGLRLVRTN
jgi:formylglycine-generating enzyme required for sulfatase activity